MCMETLFCQCHRNLSIDLTFLCPTQIKCITLWVSFIICIFTSKEYSNIDIILHYFANTSSDTQIKKS